MRFAISDSSELCVQIDSKSAAIQVYPYLLQVAAKYFSIEFHYCVHYKSIQFQIS